VGPTGLLFDREWALLDDSFSPGSSGGSSGTVLTQKACPKLAAVVPKLDLRAGSLTFHAPGCPEPLVIQLSADIPILYQQSCLTQPFRPVTSKGGHDMTSGKTNSTRLDGSAADEDVLADQGDGMKVRGALYF
jgi:hypothetical protein